MSGAAIHFEVFKVAQELTGAEIFVRCFKDEGVEYVFGYPGGAALHIYDALYKQEHVKHILVRHEQGATHAADGLIPSRVPKCGGWVLKQRQSNAIAA